MKVKFHEFAVLELDEAVEWYENQSQGLGQRFKQVLVDQIKNVQLYPSWFLIEEDFVYKAYIPKFPYKLLYTFDEDQIIIWAIAHLHRQPHYWQNRVNFPS